MNHARSTVCRSTADGMGAGVSGGLLTSSAEYAATDQTMCSREGSRVGAWTRRLEQAEPPPCRGRYVIYLGKHLEGVCVGIDVPRPDVERHQLRPLCHVDLRNVVIPCSWKMARKMGKSVDQGRDATDRLSPDLSNII